MSDWLDRKLTEQAERDLQQRKETERTRRQADAVRKELPRYMAALRGHVQAAIDRFNEANRDRADRQVLYTPETDGGFAVGTCGFSSGVRAVYCSAGIDDATISAEWRFPNVPDPSNPKQLNLSVVVRRDGSVLARGDGRRYTTVEQLASDLLVPVLFPDLPDPAPNRAINPHLDDDDPF